MSNSYKMIKSSSLLNKSKWSPYNLFLERFSLLSFGIYPKTFIKIAGLINVDYEDSILPERFNSSKCLSSFKSSGKVTKLLPYRSNDLSLGS